MSEGWWSLVAAVVSALLGAGLGYGLSARAADREWKRQRSAHQEDRTRDLAEQLHVDAQTALVSPPRGDRLNRFELFNNGRLLVARAKASDPHLSEVVEEVLAAMRQSESLEADNAACLALSGAIALWLTEPETFATRSGASILKAAAEHSRPEVTITPPPQQPT